MTTEMKKKPANWSFYDISMVKNRTMKIGQGLFNSITINVFQIDKANKK